MVCLIKSSIIFHLFIPSSAREKLKSEQRIQSLLTALQTKDEETRSLLQVSTLQSHTPIQLYSYCNINLLTNA